MTTLVLGLVLIVACLLGFGLRAVAGDGADEGQTPKQVGATSDVLTQKDLRKRLEKLAESALPKDLSMGAMCYDIAGPSARIDYVCPTCKQRTVYALEKNKWRQQYFLQYGLKSCRALVKHLPGIQATLDESEFCSHCKQVTEPKPNLIIRYPSGQTHVCENITQQDLRLLQAFLNGKDKVSSSNGAETPLKDHMTRIREILGMEDNQE